MTTRWSPGDVIIRREILGLGPVAAVDPLPAWSGRPWLAVPVHVVKDTAEHLVSYLAPGAELGFVDGDWPTANGLHPWHGRASWSGHGCLMVQRPDEHHAVWHFWEGPERTFSHWYINLQASFRRTSIGYDTQDFELDIIVAPDGTWVFKDRELLDQRVAEGRYSRELIDWVVRLGDELGDRLDAGDHWWDHRWTAWSPDPTWRDASLTQEWKSVST